MRQRTERTCGSVVFSGFESIIDQEQPVRRLTTILRKGMIPHALLFTGIEGVGKRAAAMTFAMACNCANVELERLDENGKQLHKSQGRHTTPGPCGCCRSCRKIQSGNHPDIIRINPSGSHIRISQIRSLGETLALKPYEARIRVVVISEAQNMNPEAGNALLKVLEEPPDQTLLILTAIQTSDLLPTIVSRCQHIRFNPVSRQMIEAWLVEKNGIRSEDAMIIARLANGSVSKALALSRTNWINRKNWLINELDALPSRPIGALLAFAEELSRNKEALPESLDVMLSWLRDLIVYKYCPEKIINNDLTEKVRYASRKYTVTSLLSKMETIQRAQKEMQANVNLRLSLEILILRLASAHS